MACYAAYDTQDSRQLLAFKTHTDALESMVLYSFALLALQQHPAARTAPKFNNEKCVHIRGQTDRHPAANPC